MVGTVSNRDAVGARVVVAAGNNEWTQINDGKSGYLSQSSMSQYFGLGGSDAVDRIEVTWPSGLTTTVSGPIATNTTVTITEPGF